MAATASLRLSLKTPLQFLRPPMIGAISSTVDRALQALGFSGTETLDQKPISGEFSVADMSIRATRASAAVFDGYSRYGFLFSRIRFGDINRVGEPVIHDEDEYDDLYDDEDMDDEFLSDDDEDDEDFEDDDDDEDEDSDFGSKN